MFINEYVNEYVRNAENWRSASQREWHMTQWMSSSEQRVFSRLQSQHRINAQPNSRCDKR